MLNAVVKTLHSVTLKASFPDSLLQLMLTSVSSVLISHLKIGAVFTLYSFRRDVLLLWLEQGIKQGKAA